MAAGQAVGGRPVSGGLPASSWSGCLSPGLSWLEGPVGAGGGAEEGPNYDVMRWTVRVTFSVRI